MHTQTYTTEFGGKTLTAAFTDLTAQANGSVLLTYGETAILVTAVMGEEKPNLPFFPLSVEYEEKFYAAGAILGSRFQRREGRPSDAAILSARIVDRTIRPLFTHTLRREVQVVITVLAVGDDDPDVLSVIGASLALGVSDIPWNGPVGAVRLGRASGAATTVINPTYATRANNALAIELLACGKAGTINMIETSAQEVDEATLVALLTEASELHEQLVSWQQGIIAAIGRPKQAAPTIDIPPALVELFHTDFAPKLAAALFSGRAGKAHIYEVGEEFSAAAAALEFDASLAAHFFEEQIDEALHTGALEHGQRPDGRDFTEVRELFVQAGGISPVLHGSGIFYRGGTHIFSALTLGGPEEAQLLDTMESQDQKKRFMHHYNFPPFSVGETGRVGGFNRRMIGHGALAEKALEPVIPPQTDFPYTIRLVSETLSSNGSSSMGSVCASTIALMDGGVPIVRPVAGIASGLLLRGEQYQILTDIQGPEDEHGDMDFKVAGTREGVTAIQMDVKVAGIPIPILAEALEHAKAARLHILESIVAELPAPRAHISPRAPEIISLTIKPEQIGLVIGGGGKTINSIKEDSGVDEISIEEDGTVYITGRNGTASVAAERIRALTKVYEVGERVTATITKVVDFGAFARLDPFNEGLIHISEIAPFHIKTVSEVLQEGQQVPTIVTKVEDGKIGLSIKAADPDFITPPPATPTRE
ncbi:MAG: polyribonucleotide nucleotidyltransferase [Patescibacteria group bacterium]